MTNMRSVRMDIEIDCLSEQACQESVPAAQEGGASERDWLEGEGFGHVRLKQHRERTEDATPKIIRLDRRFTIALRARYSH